MLRVKLTPSVRKRVLRNYSPTSLVSAYNLVKTSDVSVYKAAKMHGVPITTHRDRVDNRISVDTTKSGPEPVLSLEQEARLCRHLKSHAEVGYGYTRAEVIALASEYAVTLGKRTPDKPFTLQWFYDFMKRWPELKLIKPSSLSEQRAKCANEKSVQNYFNELDRIMSKYDLKDKPQNIYNIDEKGINTEYKPPNVIAGSNCKVQAVMAERSRTVTIIGSGNALGVQISPYFVFPGVRFLDNLLDGKTPGANGSMTPSGWSNSDVFRKYMKSHFTKFVQGRDSSETILVLYDGHRSHISIDLIDWALDNNIILFVLPPHTSHILQPMDVGCFGPLQTVYSHECTTFTRLNHRVVTRYDVCALACKAYTTALGPSNLQASFKRAGIYPLLDGLTMCEQLGLKLKPSTLYAENLDSSQGLQSPGFTESVSEIENTSSDEPDFFQSRSLKQKVRQVTPKKRRNVSDVIGGKALEGDTVEKLRNYYDESIKYVKKTKVDPNDLSKNKAVNKSKDKVSKTKKSVSISSEAVKTKRNVPAPSAHDPVSPQPGPSCVNLAYDSSSVSESDSEPEGEDEICCVCKSYYVPREKLDGSLFIMKWVGCEKCSHWVHLKYCTSLRVARKNTPFVCDCCC